MQTILCDFNIIPYLNTKTALKRPTDKNPANSKTEKAGNFLFEAGKGNNSATFIYVVIPCAGISIATHIMKRAKSIVINGVLIHSRLIFARLKVVNHSRFSP